MAGLQAGSGVTFGVPMSLLSRPGLRAVCGLGKRLAVNPLDGLRVTGANPDDMSEAAGGVAAFCLNWARTGGASRTARELGLEDTGTPQQLWAPRYLTNKINSCTDSPESELRQAGLDGGGCYRYEPVAVSLTPVPSGALLRGAWGTGSRRGGAAPLELQGHAAAGEGRWGLCARWSGQRFSPHLQRPSACSACGLGRSFG